jgi:hypothetical protein
MFTRTGARVGLAAVAALAASGAQANTWDFAGVIEFCDPLACGLAGIGEGDPLIGFLKADDALSGPNMTFDESAVTDYLIVSGSVQVGAADSTIEDASLTTDAADEIVSGTISFSGTFDGGIFGPIDLFVTLDATSGTWTVETPFLGLGLVASGTGAFAHEPDGDDRAAIEDNCTLDANADQRDTDADGFGNACDADFDNNCSVNFTDLGSMKAAFFQPDTTHTDMDGDGQTNFTDLGLMKGDFFLAPGPSGVPNVCTP